jgi:arylsulfatase A-like enzyme
MRPGPCATSRKGSALAPREPWFALVHTLDFHQIPELSRADRSIASIPSRAWKRRKTTPTTRGPSRRGPKCWADGARDLAIAHYDAAAAHADDELGRIVSALREQRYDADTVVVFTSNHGEELFEHGELTHAKPYEFDLRVPLIIVDPRDTAPVPNVPVMVQTIDLAPTRSWLAGIPIDRP